VVTEVSLKLAPDRRVVTGFKPVARAALCLDSAQSALRWCRERGPRWLVLNQHKV
jgi:hypothetical protein